MFNQQQFGSDLLVDVLKQHQIEYVACNPGATIRGLYDSIVNDFNKDKLKLVLCCHEEIAVALAHGYAKASGKPMAVLIHANIGLLHASMAIFNAWCDKVPIVIIGGIGPIATDKRRPWIDWIHTSPYQATVIDGYVKWHDQPINLESAVEALYRGFKIATTEPKAPVYVGVDLTIQEEKLNEAAILNRVNRFVTSALPQANNNMIETLTDIILEAKEPLIIVDHTGRNPEAIQYLIEIVELLKIPVIDCGGRLNFPTNHHFCLTGMPKDEFKKIDFILAIDVGDLSAVLGCMVNGKYQRYLDNRTKIAHITLSDFLISSWVADYYKLYPVDYPIAADSATTLPILLARCREKMTLKAEQKMLSRGQYWANLHQKLRKKWLALAFTQKVADGLTSPFVIYEIWAAIKDEDWVLTNDASVLIGKWIKRVWEFSKPDQYLGSSGGAGLGYGVGASIGAALAYKDTTKIPIALIGDGDFLFTPSALWTAAHYEVPLLIIIMNNQGYGNTYGHAIQVANDRKRTFNNAGIGNKINQPDVDFSMLAKSFGLEALPHINSVNQIKPIIYKALQYVKKHRKPILVDIKIQ